MVKGNIPDDKIEEVRSKTDIVALISGQTNLKKAGRNYLGLCPFHKEKTPSFTVSPDKQIFYCFGCGEGGNAVSFVMKANSMTFPEAIRYLAAKSGVALPEKPMTSEEKSKVSVREQIVGINRLTVGYFAKNLFSPAGKVARDYLKKRGLKEEAARTFHLGYSFDGWRHLKDFLQREKISLKLAEQAGLLVAKDERNLYDRFRGRLIFPIEDVNGRTIAFGGRLIDGEGEPKYMNSPESPVYIKGRNLYGLNITREEIRKKGFAVVVEGYFDLISLWNAGVTNVVATLGTALTREHVDLLRRYTSEVAVVFDPDEAGRKALARGLDLFLSGSIHVKAVVLPDRYDPDDFVRTFGKEKFEEIVEQSRSAVDYYIDTVLGNKGSLEHDRELLKEAVSFVVRIESVVERNLFIKRISERLGVDQALLKKEISALTAGGRPEAAKLSQPLREMSHIDAVELNLIRMMQECPDKVREAKNANIFEYFSSNILKTLGEEIQKQHEAGNAIDSVALVDWLGNEALRKQLLKHLVEEHVRDREIIDREFSDTVLRIKKKWYKEKQRLLTSQLRQAQERNDGDLCEELQREKIQLLNEEKASLK